MNIDNSPVVQTTGLLLSADDLALVNDLRRRLRAGEIDFERALLELHALPKDEVDDQDWGNTQVLSFTHGLTPSGDPLWSFNIPWHPAAYQSTVVQGKVVCEPLKPAFINNIETLRSRPEDEDLARRTMVSAARETIIKSQPRVDCMAVYGNIVLTSRLPWNVVVNDGEFLYVSSNYIQRTGVKWDFDGDTLALAFNPRQDEEWYDGGRRWPGFRFRGRPVVPIKNPISRAITPMTLLEPAILTMSGSEPWWDFTLSEKEAWMAHDQRLRAKELAARGRMTEREAIFRKSHDIQNVGRLDGLVKNFFLHQLATEPLEEKQNKLYTGDIAFEILENNALAPVRKDHDISSDRTREVLNMVESNPWRIPDPYKPYTTSTGSVGRLTPAQTDWVWFMNLARHLQRVANLEIPHFQRVRSRSFPERQRIHGTHRTVESMIKYQILKVEPMVADHRHPGVPSPVRIMLMRGNQAVALTDIRKQQGAVGGLVYSFILPPVWDVEEEKWHSPLEHLIKCSHPIWELDPETGVETLIEGFDARVINPVTNTATRNWGQTSNGHLMKADLFDPTFSWKLSRFQEWLSAYVGRYGMVVPTVSPGLTIPQFNSAVARNTVVVDYGMEDYDLDRWWEAFSQMPPVCCPASKGDDRRVRKHMLVQYLGTNQPWTVTARGANTVNPRRAGQMLSQLSRAHKGVNMTIAICLPTPLTGNIPATEWGEGNQVQITQSGIQKQLLDGVLGETVFNDRVSHKPDPEFEVQVSYMNIHGTKRVAWLKKAKNSKRIGKLIDGLGGKFMPMPTLGFDQAWYDEPVHTVPAPGSEIRVLRGYGMDPKTKEQVPQYAVYTIHPDADITADKIRVLDQNGTHGLIHRQVIEEHNVVFQQREIDLFYPVRELSDKGLLEHYMKDAQQRTITLDNGRQVVCWVTKIKHWRTSTPTENIRTRVTHRRVRGMDAHLVIAGARRAGIEFSTTIDPVTGQERTSRDFQVRVPNLDYIQSIKHQILDLMRALGHEELVPLYTELELEGFEEAARNQHVEAENMTFLAQLSEIW